jgi:predicted nucleotidyltransferase/DNA-binding XRE family transcriptional regulator
MDTAESINIGALIRRARTEARLTQAVVAKRAGVVQSVISVYENGQRTPTVPMLERLIRATGHDLIIDLRVNSDSPQSLPDTRLGRLVRRHRDEIVEMLAEHGATNPRIFGSVARGEDGPKSDVDIVVDFEHPIGLISLAALELEISDALGVDVDLGSYTSLKPDVRQNIDRDCVSL